MGKHAPKNLSNLPAPRSISRQTALEYVPRKELESAIAAGKLHFEQRGRTQWFRTAEILELNASFTAGRNEGRVAV